MHYFISTATSCSVLIYNHLTDQWDNKPIILTNMEDFTDFTDIFDQCAICSLENSKTAIISGSSNPLFSKNIYFLDLKNLDSITLTRLDYKLHFPRQGHRMV